MALTNEDVIKGLSEAGIDTPEKLAATFGYLLAIVAQARATAGVAQAIVQRDEVAAAAQEAISEAQAAEKAAEAAQAEKLARLVEMFPAGDAKKG